MQIDHALIKACVDQNRKAQKQLYVQLLPYLRAVASRYLRDTSYAKDVLQESFVKIFKGIGQYDFDKAPIKHWAAKITINHCLNYNKRVIGLPKDEFVPAKHETPVISINTHNWTDENLMAILKQMPEGYFEVFNLFVIDEYRHEEISKMLDISEASSRKKLSRAKIWLRKNYTKSNVESLLKDSAFSNTNNHE